MSAVVGVVGLAAVMETLACGKRVLLANKEAARRRRRAGDGGRAQEAAAPAAARGQRAQRDLPVLAGPAARATRRPASILTAIGRAVPHLEAARTSSSATAGAGAARIRTGRMGRKITIDSASMMNKALEVIEARWLFDMPAEKIDVLIHPQSVIHSMVEYADGAVMAQLGTPDMRLPILYAMSWPERLLTGGKRLDFTQMNALTFEQPDYNRFPGLKLAYDALAVGGSMSAVLNGANEVAVDAFLHEKIPFGAIARLVEETMQAVPVITHPTLEQVFECDRAARQKAAALMSRFEA